MPTPDGSIGSRDLCTGAAVERVIADGGVTSLKISATLQSDNFASGSAGWQINRATGSAEFQDAVIRGTLNAADITTGYIDASVIEVRNLNATELKSGSISADRIATTSLNASNIKSGTLSADYISGGTVSADILYGGTISGGDVSITNLNASNITSGVITAEYISVSNLSALSGDTGNLTITGTLIMNGSGGIKTASGGARIEIGGGVASAAQNIDFYDTTGSSGSLSASASGTNWLAVEFDLVTFEPTGGGAYRLSIGSSLSQFNTDVRINGGKYLRFQSAGSTINGEGGDWYLARAGANKVTIDGSGARISGRMDFTGYLYGHPYYSSTAGGVSTASFSWWGASNWGLYKDGSYVGITAGGTAVINGNGGSETYMGCMATGSAAYAMTTSGTQIYKASSARRFKKNIKDVAVDTSIINDWRPRSFKFRKSPDTRTHLWYVAEEIEEASGGDFVLYDEDGEIGNTADRAMFVVAVEKIKELDRRLEALEGAV